MTWAVTSSTAVKAAVLGIVAIAVTPVSVGALGVTAKIKEEARQGPVQSPHRPESLSFPKNSDPVIREPQILIQLYSGHVARGASLRSDICLMARHFVTRPALGGIEVRRSRYRRVRRVTRKARQPAATLQETAALRQVQRLMPRIPRIVPVRELFGSGYFAMAGPAEVIHFNRAHPFGIVNGRLRLRVAFPRTMTRLATHTRLGRHNTAVVIHPQRARRMTLEAPQDRRIRIEYAISYPRIRAMARCQCHGLRSRVIREPVLDIELLAGTANEGNRLITGAKGPLTRRPGKSRS